MRIAYITTAVSSAEQGGWGRYSQGLAEAVAQTGQDVRILTQRGTTHASALTDVRPVLPAFSFSIVAQVQIFFAVIKHCRDCDLLHVLIEPYAPGVALANLFLRKTLVLTLHGTYAVAPAKWNLRRLLLTFALKSAHITTTGSKNTEEKARERVHFGECRFIPNGIDTKAFHQLPGVAPGRFLLTTGAVKPRKGQDLSVRAFAGIAHEFPHLTYMIIGDIGNEKFVETVRTLARDAGVEDRVHLVGLVDEPTLLRAYNECLVYVLAARDAAGQFEGFPMVYFEANACGAPVVTTRGFGSEYAVRDGETGFLVPPEDPEALADALRKIVGDAALREQLSQQGLQWAQRHTWVEIAKDQLLPLYEDGAKNRG